MVSGFNDALDLVNGKGEQVAEIIGCVIVKSEYKSNSRFCSFGGDSGFGRYRVTLINTTFLQRHGGSTLGALRGRAEVKAINCVFASLDNRGGSWGKGVTFSGANNYFQRGIKPPPGPTNSIVGGPLRFLDLARHDYRIAANSPLVNRGTQRDGSVELDLPRFQYQHPLQRIERTGDGRIDLGAHEFGTVHLKQKKPQAKFASRPRRPGPAPRRQPNAAEARKHRDAIVKAIVEQGRIVGGPHVYVDFIGRVTRAKLIATSGDGVKVEIHGNSLTYPWEQLSAQRFYDIARRCLQTDNPQHHLLLARYCAASALDDQLRKEIAALNELKSHLAKEARTLDDGSSTRVAKTR